MSDNQDTLDRIVYVVTPKPALIEKLALILDEEDLGDLTRPHVVMTDEVCFEEFLEAWQDVIFEKCKDTFLVDEFEYGVLGEQENLEEIIGQTDDLQKCFDQWWTAVEVGYTQIETSWDSDNNE